MAPGVVPPKTTLAPRPAPGPPAAPKGGAVSGPLRCSVGIMAYNEEENIANAIVTVLGQRHQAQEISEMVVVASGCTDRTVEIVRALARQDPRITLIVQHERAGKASAINLFLQAARSPILLMVSADVLVREGTVDALIAHFRDPSVGMVGGHPIPVNDEQTFLGHTVHMMWRLHDRIARESPKLGEIVAFRNVISAIPPDTAVDEISIQAAITALGYRLVYEPRAVVFNRGPTTVADFLRQRRRIAAGHYQVAREQDYVPSTMSIWRVGSALVSDEVWTLGAVALEATARGLGFVDFLRHRPHHIWATASTTKHDIAREAAALAGAELVGLASPDLLGAAPPPRPDPPGRAAPSHRAVRPRGPGGSSLVQRLRPEGGSPWE